MTQPGCQRSHGTADTGDEAFQSLKHKTDKMTFWNFLITHFSQTQTLARLDGEISTKNPLL